MIPLSGVPPGTSIVEQTLATVNVFTMASGELPTELKFFLYGQDSGFVNKHNTISDNFSLLSEGMKVGDFKSPFNNWSPSSRVLADSLVNRERHFARH